MVGGLRPDFVLAALALRLAPVGLAILRLAVDHDKAFGRK
jgi:hypothetical protein